MTHRFIPYGHQTITEEDVAAMIDILRGDWLTGGPTIERFEDALAEYVDAEHAVAFSSGTAALHAAAAASGLGSDDLVVTSPLTFIASANCVRYVGARVGLVDIELETLNMNLAAIPEAADGLVAVHYAGLPIELRSMQRRPRVVIEDAAHALGVRTYDGAVGNCARSDLCVFSLHPVKAITTGEGGIVTTNDESMAAALRQFRSHGIVPNPARGGWYYDIDTVGFNYRLTEFQAALGLSQLSKLDGFIARRNELAERYRAKLDGLPVILPPVPPFGSTHGYHLFPILVADRRRVYDGLRAAGIGAQVHYIPVHHHLVSADIGVSKGDLSVCDAVYEQILSLPIYPGLTDEDQDYVVEVLTRIAL